MTVSQYPATNFIKHNHSVYEGAVIQNAPTPGMLNLLGLCFDETACFRKGARLGPGALRSISDSIESYSPYLDLDLGEFEYSDLGDLVFQNDGDANNNQSSLFNHFDFLFEEMKLGVDLPLLSFGGEHSVSFAPIKHYLQHYPDLLVVHLDAHADLRDGYLGNHYSHASVIRRILDHFGDGHQLIQYGIRSGTKEEFAMMKALNSRFSSLDEFVTFLKAVSPTRPIYLTFDIDFLDPAYVPGTGTPEPGGESFHNVIKIFKALRPLNFVGADLVELAPNIDPTNNSSVVATKLVRELILLLCNANLRRNQS